LAGALHPEAVAALRAGKAVVYPTETVYGLGVDARSDRAIRLLLELKGREAAKGVSVLVASLAAARSLLADEPPAAANALAAAFWPGAVTLVLAAGPHVPKPLLGARGGVGLRCSSDPVARALLASFAAPITSTSANPSGSTPARTVAEARAYFRDRVAAYVDDGPRTSVAVSTVVEFFEGRAYLKRAGLVGIDALRAVTDIEQG
jgi:tRNA threonylcarbamoyl adenosine modification protein (Sua5/YciO/YrdC/YwlC family)